MIKINNLSAITRMYNYSDLQSLLNKYPGKADVLLGDEELGETKEEKEYYSAEIELSIKSLNTMKHTIEKTLIELKKRHTQMKRLKLIASILTSVTSVGIISALLNQQSKIFLVIISAINLLSSISLIVANYLDAPLVDGKRSVPELFEKFNVMYSTSETLERQLSRMLARNKLDDDCIPTIEKAELLAIDFRALFRALN